MSSVTHHPEAQSCLTDCVTCIDWNTESWQTPPQRYIIHRVEEIAVWFRRRSSNPWVALQLPKKAAADEDTTLCKPKPPR